MRTKKTISNMIFSLINFPLKSFWLNPERDKKTLDKLLTQEMMISTNVM